MTVQRISDLGALKPGVSVEQACDLLAALHTDEIWDTLVEQRGWSYDRFEEWLADLTAELILRAPPSAAPRPASRTRSKPAPRARDR